MNLKAGLPSLRLLSGSLGVLLVVAQSVQALPPPEDTPEEVLRMEIITDARSPLNGKPLTAAEYAELQTRLQTGPPIEPELSPKVRRVIGLLRLRKFIKTFFPFIPIKSVPAKSTKGCGVSGIGCRGVEEMGKPGKMGS